MTTYTNGLAIEAYMALLNTTPTPTIEYTEGTTPANPPAGDQYTFIDSADHKLKRVNSSGTVVTIESAGGTGNITSTGAGGSEPGTPADGDLYLPNNSANIERYDGAAWESWGPLAKFTPPVLADFAWINQGSATATQVGKVVSLYADPVNTNANYRVLKKAAPGATPYTITACFLVTLFPANYVNFGIGWRQTTDGALAVNQWIFNTSERLRLLYATSATADSSEVGSLTLPYQALIWLRITNAGAAGSNFTMGYSYSGLNFITTNTVANNAFLATNRSEVCVAFDARSATYPIYLQWLSWKET